MTATAAPSSASILRDGGADVASAAGHERDTSLRSLISVFLCFDLACSMSLKIRSGVMGRIETSISSGDSASAIALAIAAGAPIVPPSPMPRNPPATAEFALDMDDVHHRHFGRGGDHVVDEAGGQKLAVIVVDEFLEQRRADALRHAAMDLAVDDHRIDDPAAILGDHVFQDLHEAGCGIDLHRGDVGRAAVVPLIGS